MKRVRKSRAAVVVGAAASVAAEVEAAMAGVAVGGAGATAEIVATAVIAAIAGNESFLEQAAEDDWPLDTCLFSVSAVALPEPSASCPLGCVWLVIGMSTVGNFLRSDGFETLNNESRLAGLF